MEICGASGEDRVGAVGDELAVARDDLQVGTMAIPLASSWPKRPGAGDAVALVGAPRRRHSWRPVRRSQLRAASLCASPPLRALRHADGSAEPCLSKCAPAYRGGVQVPCVRHPFALLCATSTTTSTSRWDKTPPAASYAGGIVGKAVETILIQIVTAPVRAFSLEKLTETVRTLEHQRPGHNVEELSCAVLAELARKRTRRPANLVPEAIRMARTAATCRSPVPGARPASEVREWGSRAGPRGHR